MTLKASLCFWAFTFWFFLFWGQPLIVAAQVDSLSWDFVMSQDWDRPERLDSFIGVHPRLFLTEAQTETVKFKIVTTHKGIWKFFKENTDSYLVQSPPSNYEAQNAMRAAGRGIPWQALAYLVTGDYAYFEGAKKWMKTICSYPRWENNRSLAGGECLFGVAVGYDWLYFDLTEEERNFIREKLVYQARAMIDGPPVHHDRWLANHNHVEHIGLAAAGFALFDEVPEAINWIRQADLVFKQSLKVFSHDGSSTEGHQYWAYSTESILRYAEMARELIDEDLYDSQWLENAANFIIYSTTPDFNTENCVMSFGDSHRNYRSHGPIHILLKLAAEFNNDHAQWLANEMLRRSVGWDGFCTWCNLIWYDANIQPISLSTLPTFWHYDDIGWLTTRSSWDEDAVMIGFKCGPFHGHKVQPYYKKQFDENWSEYHEIGGGHGHPDVNSFQIYAYGKWLAIDPEYERPKWTENHNTILVNGIGQLGEGKTWFDRKAVIGARASSTIIKAENYADYDYIIGDAGNIYTDSAGLTKFYRHLLYIKPDFIVIVDELKTDKPATFEWLLHTEAEIDKQSDHYCLIKNNDVVMDASFFLPQTIKTIVDGTAIDGDNKRIATRRILRASSHSTCETLFGIVLHPRRIADPISSVGETSDKDSVLDLIIRCGDRKKLIQLDLANQKVEFVSEIKN